MEGYSLYLPKGVKVVDKTDYNLKIKDDKNYYYLYIDTVAYYYKAYNSYVEKSDHFFSKKISYNGKIGYVDIVQTDDYYFIVVMYNYTKIETYVKKEDFSSSLMNMCTILSSVKYNDKVIEGHVGNEKMTTQEERFNIFDSNNPGPGYSFSKINKYYKNKIDKIKKDEYKFKK